MKKEEPHITLHHVIGVTTAAVEGHQLALITLDYLEPQTGPIKQQRRSPNYALTIPAARALAQQLQTLLAQLETASTAPKPPTKH